MLLNLLILWDSLLSFSWPADQQLLKMSLAKHFNWNPSSQQTECLTRCIPNFIQREKSLSGRLRSRQPSGELVFVPLCVSVLWSSSFARLPPSDVTVLSPSSSSLSRCQILFSVSSHAVCPPHQSVFLSEWHVGVTRCFQLDSVTVVCWERDGGGKSERQNVKINRRSHEDFPLCDCSGYSQ